MKLTQIRDIVAAAECGSLRAASRHIGISQPSITRSIREIEQELGSPLFERAHKGIRLTAAGQAFLCRAQAAQSELRRGAEEVAQLRGEMRGTVKVAMSAAATFALMPRALRAFRAQYPQAELQIVESFFSAVESQILDGQLDLYIGPIAPLPAASHLVVERLFGNKRAVIARKGHKLAGVTRLADLRDAEWVKQSVSERITETDFHRPFEDAGLPPPKVVMLTSTVTATLLAVANSDLLNSSPRHMLGAPIAEDLFDILPIQEPLDAAPISMVRRSDLPLTPLAEYFSDMTRRAALSYITSGDG